MTVRFTPETLRTLRQVPLFTGLADDTLALLARGTHERCCPRGTRLFAQGEPADRFYVMLDGWVKLYRDSPDGSECLVGLFTRGESFAEAAMFDRQGFPVNGGVAEDARGFEQGQTCIECHQGIAHELPEAWDESPVWAARFEHDTEADLDRGEPQLPLEAEELGEAVAAEGDIASTLAWDEVPALDVTLFLPGQASIEWIQDGSEHGGGRAFGFGDRCIWCHQDEEAQIGALASSAEKIETYDLGDKRGHVPMAVQTAFDDDYLYMRFQWEDAEHAPLPFVDGGMMDPENEIKLTVSFADDRVDMADRGGCWASCHHDSAYMPDAPEQEALEQSELGERLALMNGVTKYLTQSRTESGYILEQRHFDDSEAVVFSASEAEGVWTAYLTRALRTGAPGDKPLALDGKYNVNFALHDDHAASRFHHVSWQFGLMFGAEEVDEEMVEINAMRIER